MLFENRVKLRPGSNIELFMHQPIWVNPNNKVRQYDSYVELLMYRTQYPPKRKPVNFPVVHFTEQNKHSSMGQQISVIFI